MTWATSTPNNTPAWLMGSLARSRTENSETARHLHSRTAIADPQEGKTMAVTIDSGTRSPSKFKRTESLEFRLIFAAAFAIFLVAALAERLLPHRWLHQSAARKSVLEQAKEAANTCAAYAFMG